MTRGDFQKNSMYMDPENQSILRMPNGGNSNQTGLFHINRMGPSQEDSEHPLKIEIIKHFNSTRHLYGNNHQSNNNFANLMAIQEESQNQSKETPKTKQENKSQIIPSFQFKKSGFNRMGTIGVKKFNKADAKNQLQNDELSYYNSSQSQFLLGSLYDKQSMTGGSQTVFDGAGQGINLEKLNNQIATKKQKSQSPGQGSPSEGGSNPTNGDFDCIVNSNMPVFQHQRTEIQRTRKQSVKVPFKKGTIQAIGEKIHRNQTIQSKGGTSGLSVMNDVSNGGDSSENQFHQMSISQNSSSIKGVNAFHQAINNQQVPSKNGSSGIQSRDINYSDNNSNINLRPGQNQLSTKRSIGDQTSYFPGNQGNNLEELKKRKPKNGSSNDTLQFAFNNQNYEGSLYNYAAGKGTFENQDLTCSLRKHETLKHHKHLEQQPIYVKQGSNITFLKAQQSIKTGSSKNIGDEYHLNFPHENQDFDSNQDKQSPHFTKKISKKQATAKMEINFPYFKKAYQTQQTSNFDSSFPDTSVKDSSFCTNSSLDGAEYDEEIITAAKKHAPNRDKTPHNNKNIEHIKNPNQVKNQATKKEKQVKEKDIAQAQIQPQSFQDWAHDLKTPAQVSPIKDQTPNKTSDPNNKQLVFKPSIIIVPPNQEKQQSEEEEDDNDVEQKDETQKSPTNNKKVKGPSDTSVEVLIYNFDQKIKDEKQEVPDLEKPLSKNSVQFEDINQNFVPQNERKTPFKIRKMTNPSPKAQIEQRFVSLQSGMPKLMGTPKNIVYPQSQNLQELVDQIEESQNQYIQKNLPKHIVIKRSCTSSLISPTNYSQIQVDSLSKQQNIMMLEQICEQVSKPIAQIQSNPSSPLMADFQSSIEPISNKNGSTSTKIFSNLSYKFKRITDQQNLQQSSNIMLPTYQIPIKEEIKDMRREFASDASASSQLQTPKTNEDIKIQILSTPDDSSQSYQTRYHRVSTPYEGADKTQQSNIKVIQSKVPPLNLPKNVNSNYFQVINELPDQELKSSYNTSQAEVKNSQQEIDLKKNKKRQKFQNKDNQAISKEDNKAQSQLHNLFQPNLQIFDNQIGQQTIKNKTTNNFLIFRGGTSTKLYPKSNSQQPTQQRGRMLCDFNKHVEFNYTDNVGSGQKKQMDDFTNIMKNVSTNKFKHNNSFDNPNQYQTAPVTRVSSQLRGYQNFSLLIPDSSIHDDHAYKYSHNSPNLGGRNLISAIKNVAKINATDMAAIPSLLQEVRINQLKHQLQKQLQQTHNLIIEQEANTPQIKLPITIEKRTKSQIVQKTPFHQDSSNRLLLIEKNTQIDQGKHQNYDQSSYPYHGDEGGSSISLNTPGTQNYPFHIKAHYEQMISPESSDRTPDATSVMDQTVFNPADYTYEIQQMDESQIDYETSMISRDDTLSYMNMPLINNDLGYLTDNSRVLSKPHNGNQYNSTLNALTTNNKSSTVKTSEQNVNYNTPLNGIREYARSHFFAKQDESYQKDESFTNIAAQEIAQQKTPDADQNVNRRPKFNGIIIQSEGEEKSALQEFQNHENGRVADSTPKNKLVSHQETKYSQMSSNYKDKDLEEEDFARAQTQAIKNIDFLQKTSKQNQLKHLSTSPKVNELQQITKINLMNLPINQLLPQSSLSPINRLDTAMRSQRSITTVSAVSQKVNGKKIINQYIIIKKIGQGKFAKVAQVMDQNTKVIYAMKIMNKIKLKKIFVGKNKFAYQAVETEIAVLKMLEHENIVHLYEIIDDPKHDKLYLIQEYITNGTLQSRIVNKDPKIKDLLTEERCRKYFRQLISAIEYCHECAQIIHRDIKPENILIDSNDNVKLSDFGVSFMMENGSDQIETSAGSYYYFSPEACLGAAYKGRKSDIWACGVTLYFMTYKCYPFEAALIPELFTKIQNDEPTYRPAKTQQMTFEITYEMKDMIKKILTKNPEKRLTIQQIKEHPWITQNGADPMAKLEICELEPTEAEKKNIFKEINYVGTAVLRKLSQMIEEKSSNSKVNNKQKTSQNNFLNIMKTAIANSVKDGRESN